MGMTLGDIRDVLSALALTRRGDMTITVGRAFCADMMSDVLAFSVSHSLLITGLTNAQAIRTADVANVLAIVFVNNKRPDFETIAIADAKNIPLFVTGLSMFDACGRLYERGLRSQTGQDR